MSAAPISLRVFWTWDHSTQWTLNAPGGHDFGASNEYGRSPESFLRDYELLFKWAGEHGIDAVVVWGLLRDLHGGIESAKRLCDYAHENGVKLLAGAGLNAYGGVYYEGDSPYSLEQRLRMHPELLALDEAGAPLIRPPDIYCPQPIAHACPSRPENREFAQESLRWLFETLEIDGVQTESGDTGTCRCPLCKERRQYPVSVLSWEDMALMYPLADQAIRSVRPEALVLLETYSHPQPIETQEAPGFGGDTPPWAPACLAQFPKDAVVEWVGDHHSPEDWSPSGPPSAHQHVLRIHSATCWGGRLHDLAVAGLAGYAQAALRHGFTGFSMFGESSPFRANAELNYLAFADFGSEANPDANLDSFLDRLAAPLLGGPERARCYVELAATVGQPEQGLGQRPKGPQDRRSTR